MSKRTKLRTAPVLFFEDSQHPALRRLAPLAQSALRSRLLADVLEEPVEALASRRLPLVSLAARLAQRRDARQRARTIASHGTPTVSVVVAAHNAEATLEASITSLLAQTHRALEVVVVDDGSVDGTAMIAERLAAADPRLRLREHAEQRGAAQARNTGLAAATGAFLTFQDADDHSHPERIERQLAALLARPDAALAVCNFRREAPDGTPLTVNGRRFAKNLISMLFPRSVFEQVGYLRPLTVGEDAEYYERIKATFGPKSEVHRFETLYFARFDPGSLLFSHGDVTRRGNEVTYSESSEARRRREAALAHLDAIRAGKETPYVPRAGGKLTGC